MGGRVLLRRVEVSGGCGLCGGEEAGVCGGILKKVDAGEEESGGCGCGQMTRNGPMRRG